MMSTRTVQRAAVLFLLLTLFGLLVFSVGMKSPTSDEQNHVARGLAYLRTGDLRLSQEHPPGVNAWEAWPLLLDPSLRLPLDSPSWANAEWYGFADELLWHRNDHPQATIYATRVPVMWLSLLLAALVYRWARVLGGEWAGLSAMALVVLDPNLLAHGRLTTTDMGVTCLSFAAMWTLWRALKDPSWGRWVWAGVSFGLAQLTKFSALALGPVTVLVVALAATQQWAMRRSLSRQALSRWFLRLLVLVGAGGLVVWAGYGFTWGPIAALGGLPGPAPAYWAGIETILRRTGGGSIAFLSGQYSESGWWYYFPVAFAIKTPLPTLAILLVALVLWVRMLIHRLSAHPSRSSSATRPFDSHLSCLVLPILALWGIALAGSFNIGYRHILPSLPLLYTLAGWSLGTFGIDASPRLPGREAIRRLAHWAGLRVDRWHGGVIVVVILLPLFIWLAVDTLSVAPHYLAFFSTIVGGPKQGYRYLVDSNLDWGQDLPGLEQYVTEHGIARVYLSWFGAAHPEAYELRFHPLPGFWRFGGDPAAYGLNPYAPAPGLYAISASNLQGIKLADRDTYAWFRERRPDDHVGHSILLYRVARSDPVQTVVLGVSMAQLADAERTLLASGASVRKYDPATGIILPRNHRAEDVWFIAPQALEGAVTVREGPGYVVFRILTGQPEAPERETRFGPYVQMLNLEVGDARISQGQLAVTIDWQVDESPHRAAVSFVHVLDRQGRYVAGWDGLTAPATCWQAGDRIEQQYRIEIPVGLAAGDYSLEVGWYDAETLERWSCYVDGQSIGDRFLLEGIEVEL